MDELVDELNRLRIDRDAAARAYQRTVDESVRREREILDTIVQNHQITGRERREAQFNNNIRNNRRNPIREGDIVRITNHCKEEEHGIVGEVTHITRRMVELRCADTQKYYSRAWWNVERAEEIIRVD